MRRHRKTRAALVLVAAAAVAQAADTGPQCAGVPGDPALSIQVCTRAIEFGSLERPDLAKAYYIRGAEWSKQGNVDRAIADYSVALELDPKFASAFYNRALSWSNKGDPDRAISDYDAAIKLEPRDANAYLGRAAEWIAKADYELSVADYDAALRIHSLWSVAHFGLGRARFYAGDFASAASDFQHAHQLEPSVYSALWLFLARKRAHMPAEKTLARDAGTAGLGAWPAPVVGLYLGRAAPDAIFRAATHPDPARQRDLRCEASFYVAHWHLLRGARDPAARLLREAESTCPRTFIEREGAVAELKRMQQGQRP